MVQASKSDDFGDLSYGDETRRNGDYVGLPHDQDSGGTSDVLVGQAVSVDGSGNIKQMENGDTFVGVLQNYQRFGDSGGRADPGTIDQDRDATVKTQGTAKVEVASDVVAGEALGVGSGGTAGVLDNGDAPEDSLVALSDAIQDDRPDGTTAYYAEVLIR